MATFDVDTNQIWQTADRMAGGAEALGKLASILRSRADSAGATGDATSAAALHSFILQWSGELAAEAEAANNMAYDLRAAAALYDSTESLATASFTPGLTSGS